MKLHSPLAVLALSTVSLLAAAQVNSDQQHSLQATTTTTVEVLYSIGTGSQTTVATYNINPSTLTATKVGNAFTIAPPQSAAGVLPSPNDHFIYVLWYNSSYSTEYLDVYQTNSLGVPLTRTTATCISTCTPM